jgi:hypothetical protein
MWVHGLHLRAVAMSGYEKVAALYLARLRLFWPERRETDVVDDGVHDDPSFTSDGVGEAEIPFPLVRYKVR